MIYNVNGNLVCEAEATVSVTDRGFRYGDAAFETLRAYGGDLFRWRDHAARLDATCEILGLDHGINRADLQMYIDETLDANDLDDAYVRLSITRGPHAGKLDPPSGENATVVVVTKPLPRSGTEGRSVWDDPAELETVETRRVSSKAIPANAKTHNYLNGILARRELSNEADEALMRDDNGSVAEGTTSNIFFVSDETLCTPGLNGPVLPGITRKTVLEIAEIEGISIRPGTYHLADVREADEVFCTNTTWEIRPVARLDDHEFDVLGPVTNSLTDALDELIEREYYS